MNTVSSQKSYLETVVKLMANYQDDKLSFEQKANRDIALNYLSEYADGELYASDEEQEITPIFKNSKGVYCALGFLLVKTGCQKTANKIANDNNYIDVEKIDNFSSSDIGAWSLKHGISRSEAIIIQRYAPTRAKG